jgi:integrase
LICEPGQRDRLVFDSKQKGLAVRVTASGGKTYLAQYTRDGKKQRVPLGAVNAISLADARNAAQAIMGDVAHGRDPAGDRKAKARKAAPDADTLAVLLDRWAKLHLKSKRTSYAAETQRAIRATFAKHLNWPATAITRPHAISALDQVVEAGSPIMAARAGAYLCALYGWAKKRGTVSENPFIGLPRAPTTRRERVLTDDEIRRVWKATEGPSAFNAIVRTLLLTGQRRDEVAAMPWGELSPDGAIWTIPGGPNGRTKNKVTHVVPLSAQARAIIEAQPRLNNNPFVFAGLKGQNFRGFACPKAALDRTCGVDGWVLHDLRRTVATGLQKLGVRLAGIVGVYQRHEWADEKRAALSARVEAIVEGRAVDQGSNVIGLRA